MPIHQPIITLSHLRWNFVYQRPQHLMSRLSARRPVFFVEEPVYTPGQEPRWELESVSATLTVCRPYTPIDAPGFHADQMPCLRELVSKLIAAHNLNDSCLWLYTPMAYPLHDVIKPSMLVYDCMDQLSAFLFAPPSLIALEEEVLERADLVFTGGASLYKAKANRNRNTYCFPSSVDAPHFRTPKPEPAEQAALPSPRLGFFGVIDERMDLPLIDRLAAAHPEWQISLVGPVVKIDPQTLPQRDNIHYFGQRSYAELPAFLHGWDVCLLPFARNEATRFISPTKTLEYMAAGKPIVSTSITDVAEQYADTVYLADDPNEFVQACERALGESPAERESREQNMRSTLAKTSWEKTAAGMDQLLTSTAAELKAGSTPAVQKKVVIIGAGPTGLAAAYHLGEDSLLLEQCGQVGGWCRSIEDGGFTFDHAGHIMFSNDEYVHGLYKLLLGDNYHWQNREAWIYSKNVYTRYPFQGALYGLPPDVIRECIVGAIEARFGEIKSKKGHKSNNGSSNGKSESLLPEAAVLEESVPEVRPVNSKPKNFEEFIYSVWGAGIAKHFAIPYNKKLWAVPLTEMETSWLEGRVPLPDLEEMIEGAVRPVAKPMGPNARFGYPLKGGFQALMDGFLPHLKGDVRLNSRVASISPATRSLVLTDGTRISYENLISTMPLPVLIRLMRDEAPPAIREAANGLRHVSVRCVNLGVNRANITDKHWIYYPEDTVFHRIFLQGNASPHCNPPGGFGMTCEITYSDSKPLPCEGQALIDQCIADCRKVGIITQDDEVIVANQVDMDYAYVIYDHDRTRNVELIRDWLSQHDIVLAGRYSEWEYYNSDHAFVAGRRGAEKVKDTWRESETAATSLPAVQNVRAGKPS